MPASTSILQADSPSIFLARSIRTRCSSWPGLRLRWSWKAFLEPAPRHRRDAHQILHADRFVAVVPDVTQAPGHARVLHRQQIAALAHDQLGGGNPNRLFGSRLAAHQPVQQLGPAVAELFQIGVHARNGGEHRVRRQEIVFRPDDRDLVGNRHADLLRRFQHIQRVLIVGGEQRQGFGGLLHPHRQPVPLAFPLLAVGAKGRALMPFQPVAGMARLPQGGDKPHPPLIVGPVGGVAVKGEVREAARQKMIGHQLGRMGVVFEHAGEMQMRAAEAEVHRGLVLALHKLRQVVPRPEPGQDAVALPAPGNNLLPRQIGREKPRVLLSVALDAPVEPVVIPAERQQDSSLYSSHVALAASARRSAHGGRRAERSPLVQRKVRSPA